MRPLYFDVTYTFTNLINYLLQLYIYDYIISIYLLQAVGEKGGTDIEVTDEHIASGIPGPLQVRRGSEPALNQILVNGKYHHYIIFFNII